MSDEMPTGWRDPADIENEQWEADERRRRDERIGNLVMAVFVAVMLLLLIGQM